MANFKIGFVTRFNGLPMAMILQNNYPLFVWNRSKKNLNKINKKKIEVCKNLIDLPNKCEVIIMMLSSDKVCIEILNKLRKN